MPSWSIYSYFSHKRHKIHLCEILIHQNKHHSSIKKESVNECKSAVQHGVLELLRPRSSSLLVEKGAKVPLAIALELVALNGDKHLLLQQPHVRVRRDLFVFAQLATQLPLSGGRGGHRLSGLNLKLLLHACRGRQGGGRRGGEVFGGEGFREHCWWRTRRCRSFPLLLPQWFQSHVDNFALLYKGTAAQINLTSIDRC